MKRFQMNLIANFVEDLVEAHVRVMEALATGDQRIYNLGIGKGYSVKEIVDAVKRVVDRPFRVESGPRRAGDPPALYADASKIERELGWRAEPAGKATREGWHTWVTPGRGVVRAPAAGDRLIPLGGVGHRSASRLLMEARVPRSARAGYPVVARDAEILWLPGVCRSAARVPRAGEPALRLEVYSGGGVGAAAMVR